MLGVSSGGQQETAGGAGEGHDEHAPLIGAHLRPGGRDGSVVSVVIRGSCDVGTHRQAVGDGVDEEAGAGQRVAQTQVGPAVAFQAGDHDELPFLARTARRGHDGDALGAPALGSHGVGGEDLGVELGQEAARVLARMALGPDLGALEQGGDDVEVVLCGLGQDRARRVAGGPQGGGAPRLRPARGIPGSPQEGLDVTRGIGDRVAHGGAQGLDDPGGGEEPARLDAEGLPLQGAGEGAGPIGVRQQGQERGVGAGPRIRSSRCLRLSGARRELGHVMVLAQSATQSA